MKYFVICAVRKADKEYSDYIAALVNKYEEEGHEVYWPARDTDQDDPIGYRICVDNRAAIENADAILFAWDGESTGSLFDLGIAWMARKEIVIIPYFMPPVVEGKKSYQAMAALWEDIGANGQHPPLP